MAIEIQRQNSPWVYRISPTDASLIERRENKHGARWLFYAHRDTPNEAKQALLQLEKEGDE